MFERKDDRQSLPPQAEKPRGWLGNTIQTLRRVLAVLAGAVFFSIIIEWAGMIWWWPQERSTHSRDMVKAELSYLGGDMRSTLLSGDTRKYATAVAGHFYTICWVYTGIEWMLKQHARMNSEAADTFKGKLYRFVAVRFHMV